MMVIVGTWVFGSPEAGWWFMFIQAITVFLALVGTTLSCMCTGARVTYAMGRDDEVPSHFGMLHGKNLTPHRAIWTLAAVSAVVGIFAVLMYLCGPAATDALNTALTDAQKGSIWYPSFLVFSAETAKSLPNSLLIVTLASNFGTFLLYMLTCGHCHRGLPRAPLVQRLQAHGDPGVWRGGQPRLHVVLPRRPVHGHGDEQTGAVSSPWALPALGPLRRGVLRDSPAAPRARLFCSIRASLGREVREWSNNRRGRSQARWGLVHFSAGKHVLREKHRPKTWTCPLPWRQGDSPIFAAVKPTGTATFSSPRKSGQSPVNGYQSAIEGSLMIVRQKRFWFLLAATVVSSRGADGSGDGDVAGIGDESRQRRRGVRLAPLRLRQRRVGWALIAAFLVMFMQAGFALLETGLCRAKNAAHTMSMNLMIYALGGLGFWAYGFAIGWGNWTHGAVAAAPGWGSSLGPGAAALNGGWGLGAVIDTATGAATGAFRYGLIGLKGFFLGGLDDAGVLVLFFFMMVLMNIAATIPTGAMAERWRWRNFCLYGLWVALPYGIYANWVWGGGWLAQIGVNWDLGHGAVDFAGSGVVHAMGGLIGLAGVVVLGPRIGKYSPEGKPLPIPAHHLPMVVVGTLILALGWFGFNSGSAIAGASLRIGAIVVNTALAGIAGAIAAMLTLQVKGLKPDTTIMCNGMLSGLVAISAPSRIRR